MEHLQIMNCASLSYMHELIKNKALTKIAFSSCAYLSTFRNNDFYHYGRHCRKFMIHMSSANDVIKANAIDTKYGIALTPKTIATAIEQFFLGGGRRIIHVYPTCVIKYS